MAKIEVNPVQSGYNIGSLNESLQRIEDEFHNKVVYRDEVSPMNRDLDLNGYRIINQANAITIDGFNWRDEWVTATAYNVGDVVNYSGTAYIAVEAHTAGVFATDLANEYWQIVVEANLPDQFGEAGKFLQTDGFTASWEDIDFTKLCKVS